MIKTKALCSAAILGLVATLFAGCGDGDSTATRICEPEAATCTEGNSGEVCSADGTRLVEFNCGSGETCEDGACVASCEAGAERCASNAAAQVCSTDGDEWIAVACTPGTACVEGEGCVPTAEGVQICEPGDSVCASDGTVKTCDADGSSWIFDKCAENETCSEGTCSFDEDTSCTPREKRCVDGASAICKDDGSGWTVTDCPEGVRCDAGLCQGPACVPGSTMCAPITEEHFQGMPYEFGALFTCNEDGTGYERTVCETGSYCAYDNVTNAEIDKYVSDLKSWYGTWYEGTDIAFPTGPDLSDSVASCQTPACPAPHKYKDILQALDYGSDFYGFYGSGTSFCGTPDDPALGGSFGGTDGFTQCEGLPPFKNLEWASYDCADHETCHWYGTWYGAFCGSDCNPGSMACADSDSTTTCQADGTWGVAEQCPTDPDQSYEYMCVAQGDFQGGSTASCMDPICAYIAEEIGFSASGFGACTADGQFRACNPDGTLADPEDCPGYCQTFTTLGGTWEAGGQTVGSCQFECVDGQEECLQPESSGSPLYRVCIDGSWSTTAESCGADICYDGDTVDLYYGSFYGEQLDTVICGGQCNPGTQFCYSDTEHVTCDEDGQWGEPVECAAGYCEDSDGFITCEMECVPGQIQCSGDGGSQRVCGDDGIWGDYAVCEDVSESCRIDQNGKHVGCVQCLGPNTGGNNFGVTDMDCDPLNVTAEGAVRTCTTANQWGEGVACDTGTTCTESTNGPSSVAWCEAVPAP